MINLTKDEREKFARWLLQEAHTAGLLAERAMRLLHLGDAAAKRLRAEAAAFVLVAQKLESAEEVTIG